MVNYNNGKIYKIESNIGDKVYIGSTTKEYLSQRMTAHRKNYNRWKQGKRDLTTSFLLFDEYGLDNCTIVLLESCSCESKDELHAREAHYIRTITCVNKCIPGRTSAQYDEDNKDKIRERKQKYYIEKKSELRDYYETNKEHIQERKQKYYELNKELIKEKSRQYRAAKKLQQQTTPSI